MQVGDLMHHGLGLFDDEESFTFIVTDVSKYNFTVVCLAANAGKYTGSLGPAYSVGSRYSFDHTWLVQWLEYVSWTQMKDT